MIRYIVTSLVGFFTMCCSYEVVARTDFIAMEGNAYFIMVGMLVFACIYTEVLEGKE